MRLSGLHLYPVKSAKGVDVPRWPVDDFGLAQDRRFMVVDADGRFMTQRAHPQMIQLSAALTEEGLTLELPGRPALTVTRPRAGRCDVVEIWGERVPGRDAGDDAAGWLSTWLGEPCRLVYMADDTRRPVDPDYTDQGAASSRPGLGKPDARVSFADGFPFLLIGEASLQDLNGRMATPLEMARFRPNLVVSGAPAFAEDSWLRVRVGPIEFDIVKPCARCAIPTVDLTTGLKGKEPLRTLATYRKVDGEVLFGQNLVHRSTGSLTVGDPVEVLAAR